MLTFFNTLSKKLEVFKPIKENEVSLYTCGPTVYNYAHIGNLRTYIFEDILKRTLEKNAYVVKHVMNITNVGHLESDADAGDDKMELAAKKQAKSPYEIAKYYEEAFFSDTDKLHIIRPSIVCRATQHILEMQDFILELEKKGFTYTVDGNVYFRINKFSTYADFSKRKLEELQEGARVDIDTRKENPLDFVLWFSNSKFPNQIMKWPSPWGVGFPGWHIECSAMASKYLGDHFDIHCGGIDHISIHHTNEIAQSEAKFSKKWVNYWLHGEFLVLQKEKMSKSLGNFLTLKSLVDQGFDPLHYRYLCLLAHYRSQLFFSLEALESAKNAFESLRNRVLHFKLNPQACKNSSKKQELKDSFFAAMNDDLSTPVAIAIMWQLLKDADLSNGDKLELLLEFDSILGFDMNNFAPPNLSKEQLDLIHKREEARKNKDFATSDQLRDELLKQKVCLKDTKDGTVWYLDF